MALYETIFHRRSVREYDKKPLDENTLSTVKQYLDAIPQLDGLLTKLEIVTGDKVTDNNRAPHYIVAYCKENFAEYINVGYVLQQADLYLQDLGLGTLWLGIPKMKSESAKQDYAIMMSFGKTAAPVRNSENEFNRLPLKEIADENNAVTRAVRLAPSAMNSQPWKVSFEQDKAVLDYFGRGLLKGILRKTFSKIDLGIAAKYAELALLSEGKKIKSITPKGNEKEFSIEISYS